MYVWTDPAGYGVCKNCGWPRERHGGKLTGDPCPVRRQPLTTSQHILWLLVTVFTFGIGGILWAVKASRGNQVLDVAPQLPPGWQPPPGWQWQPQPGWQWQLQPPPGWQPPPPPGGQQPGGGR